MDCWMSAERWIAYLRNIEHILDDSIFKLDDNDPIRRRSSGLQADGQFIVQFGKGESSRSIFGKFKRTKIEFSILIYKNGKDSFNRYRDNCVNFYAPQIMGGEDCAEKLYQLFNFTNESLRPFYAYSDLRGRIIATKPCGASLDISRELLGIGWLTYFGPAYRHFFGDRLTQLEGWQAEPTGGVTLRLAQTAGEVGREARETVVRHLGQASFANGAGPKEPGQFALKLEDLADAI